MRACFLTKKANWLLAILLSCYSLITFAQPARLSDDPTQFVADVQKMMAYGGVPNYIKAGQNLDTLWKDSRLTAIQQKSVMAIARRMAAKGQKAGQPFEAFLNSIYAAFNGTYSAPQTFDGFLATATQIVETYDGKSLAKFFEAVSLLYNKRMLYNTNYNRLYVYGGNFTFRIADETAEFIKTAEAANKAKDDGWGNILTDSTNMSGPISYQKKAIPNLSGAIIEFKNTKLTFVTFNDSTSLSQTTGKVSVKDGIWTGIGGKMTWESAQDSTIFVTLGAYSFNINTPKIAADDAKLSFAARLVQPVDGAFEFESKRRPKGQSSPYPRFISYGNNAVLKNLTKNVQYKGGFSLLGLKISSGSLNREPSEITVTKNGKTAFKARSRQFSISDTLISSPMASFVTYIGANDSLFHPGIRLSYDDREGLLKCARADGTAFQSIPFSDTYHQVNIFSEMLRWHFDRSKIEFYVVAGRTEVPITIESFNYFKPERFRAISEEFGFHPLLMVANYIAKEKKPQFFLDDLALYYKKDYQVLNGAFGQMIRDGYLDKNEQTDLISLSRKGLLYVLAYNKDSDYDNLRITSQYAANNNTANAAIDLTDKAMTIRGVDQFVISDSLKIIAIPSDKQIKMMKNRDFVLNGTLKSANFKFAGRDLVFNYDKFFVDLTKIDKITFIPKAVYDKGGSTEVGDDIVYEKSGRIYLNDTKNKSGKLKNSVFPRLTVPEGMTVYFDQPDRGNLVYSKKVFFKIPNIDYDSLGIQDISFVGEFTSDGIFPTFPAHLKSMPDNSLGFSYKPPADGFKAYGTNTVVKFTKDLVMDKNGLRSEGTISHLSAKIPTQSMLFMTDSLMASGMEAEIKEATIGKAYFPRVDLRNFTLRWAPKLDSMTLTTKGNSFNFYNGTTKLEGKIVLRSVGLFGKGFLKRDDSELTSQDIKFNKEGFLAGEAQYKILSTQNTTRPVFLGSNVDIDFNIVKGVSNISAVNKIDAVSSFDFPFTAYRTSINRAQWNINAKIIGMRGDVNTSTFTATAPEQELLTFNGSAALYEIDKMTLSISGVPHIKTADAKVIPEKGIVSIRRNGEMQPFTNARLVLDTLNEYHRLKNGNIQILSRSKFTGDAMYQYTTILKDTVSIKMSNFTLRQGLISAVAPKEKDPKNSKKAVVANTSSKAFYSVANATVAEAENFIMSPKMQYKGGLTMISPEKNLQYDGYVKPIINTKKRNDLVTSWVPFKELPTRDIALKITPTLKNEMDLPVSVGLHFRTGTNDMYATFVSSKELRSDPTIFTANGLLNYDEKAKIFRLVPEPKANEEIIDPTVNYSFDDSKSKVSYQGRLNLITDKAKEGSEMFLTSGSAVAQLDSLSYQFNTLLSLNFEANPQIVSKIGEDIIQSNLSNQNGDAAEPDWDRLSSKLTPLIGKKPTESYVNRAMAAHKSLSEASPKLNATIVLSNVNLRWSGQQNAFYSVGKIGVSNLNSADINAQMDGMVEIRKGQRGDEITVYLEASPENWYCFDYMQGKLAMVSSIPEVNDLARGKKGDKKDSGIIEMTENERNDFVAKFMSLYRPRKPAKKTTAKPTTTPVANKTATPTKAEEEPKAEAPTTAATKTDKKDLPKDTKVAAKDTKITAPKDTTKAKTNGKVAQTPPKPPVKKEKKEEEKEGF